jgi:hypothetical protein
LHLSDFFLRNVQGLEIPLDLPISCQDYYFTCDCPFFVHRYLLETLIPDNVFIFVTVVSSFFIRDIAAVVINPWQSTRISTVIIYFSLSIGLNVCLTGLIIHRICWRSPSSTASTVMRIAKIFAESAALFVITALIFIGLCLKRNFGQNIVLPILGQLQVRSSL